MEVKSSQSSSWKQERKCCQGAGGENLCVPNATERALDFAYSNHSKRVTLCNNRIDKFTWMSRHERYFPLVENKNK